VLGIDSVAGVEWWVRRRLILESQSFHFDKDEYLFQRSGQLVSPRRISIFYLSDAGGPTLVALQKVNEYGCLVPEIPTELMATKCTANQLLDFPGDLSHGVYGQQSSTFRITLVMNWWDSKPVDIPPAPVDATLPKLEIGSPRSGESMTFTGTIFTRVAG
jgi:hypothetical protein